MEIDALILGSGSKRMAAYLQTLKETMADPSEALRLRWIDINGNVITINRARFKPILDYAARKWKLPRLIRVLISDTIWPDTTHLGAKLLPDVRGKPYFDIHINLITLHEARNAQPVYRAELSRFINDWHILCCQVYVNERKKPSRLGCIDSYARLPLVALLRDEIPPTTVGGNFQLAPKTDKFYSEITRLAEEND